MSENLNVGIPVPEDHETNITMTAANGRTLLTVRPDGTVEADLEDCEEAARIFVEHIRNNVARYWEHTYQIGYDAGVKAKIEAPDA